MRPRAEEIRAELERILHSSVFLHSERLSRFLRLVVSSAIESDSAHLKEVTIAFEVFDKGPDFDPRLDSIVRVEASRLRAKLMEYYETAGQDARIRIELPKGGYAPVFHFVEPNRRPGRPLERLAWFSVLLFVSLVAGFLLLRAPPGPAASPMAQPRPLTTWPGLEIQPCVSPDGDRAALVWNGPEGSNFDIYLYRIGNAARTRLTTDPAADRSPAWSRDGRRIAYIRDAREGRQLRILDLEDGSDRQVASLGIPPMFPQLNIPRLVEWSKDGRNLVVADRDPPESPFALFLISIENGDRHRLTVPPAHGVGDRDPAVSGNGRLVAFTRSPTPVTSDLFVMPLSGGEPRRLTSLNQPIRGIAWTEDDQRIVFSSEQNATGGSGELFQVLVLHESTVPPPLPVGGPGPRAALPSISRHGGVLVYQDSFAEGDVWRLPLVGRGDPESLIASTRAEGLPACSPDGTRIAFSSNRSGHWEIWVADADGADQRQITHVAGTAAAAPRWSPDGKQLAFFQHSRNGASDVYVLPSEGGAIRRLTSHPGRDELPSWSKTGAAVYFQSNRTGAEEIWLTSPDGPTECSRVTDGGGAEPLEDPDGRYLYYRKPQLAEIWRRPASGGAETLVSRIDPGGAWTVGRHGVYVAQPDREVVLIDPRGGERRRIARLPDSLTMGLAVTPDERWLLFTRRAREAADIMVVFGYR